MGVVGVPAGRSQGWVGGFPSVSSSFRVGPPCQGRSFVASLRDRLRRPLTDRPAAKCRRLPGNPQRNGTDVYGTSGGISDQAGWSGAASPGIRADEPMNGGRDSRQIATRSSRLSVRRPSGAAARREGRRIRHPGPVGATNRYALLEFRRPRPVWGCYPHPRATGSASELARRVRSLRAPRIPASGGRLGLLPAPNADRMDIRGRWTPQIATRSSRLGVRRFSWAGQRGERRQNSLPSGSARIVQEMADWSMPGSVAPRARSRAASAARSSPE
ncbi:hypothetical protein BX286_4428 [Streptomyces sp. 3211.6]|nr:hypothetical protein BX286_4428 [Streptomyces sp. 3211.6]